MEEASHANVAQYLRLFSYLLIICGAAGVATGVAVAWSAIADAATSAGSPFAAGTLAFASLATGALTVATGILGRRAARQSSNLGSFRTMALVDIVATVLGLGLCYTLGATLPASLLFNLLLMAICLVIGNNLQKTQN